MKIFLYQGFTKLNPPQFQTKSGNDLSITPAHMVTTQNLSCYFQDENLHPSKEVVDIIVKQLMGLENGRFFTFALHKDLKLTQEQLFKYQESLLNALKENLTKIESPLLIRNDELISPQVVLCGKSDGIKTAETLNDKSKKARDLHWELGPLLENNTRPVDRPIIIIAVSSSGLKGGITRIADVAGCLVDEFGLPVSEIRSLSPENESGIPFKPFWYAHIGKEERIRIGDKEFSNHDIMDAVEGRYCWTLNTDSDEEYPMRLTVINNSFKLAGPMHGVSKIETISGDNGKASRYIRRGDLVIPATR